MWRAVWLGGLGAGVIGLAGAAWAGRPLTIDDAGTAESGHFEFEAGVGHDHDPDCDHWDFPFGLAYGVAPRLEAGVGFGGQFEERTEILEHDGEEDTRHESGVGDLAIGAKWQFVDACPLGAQHAALPAVKLPTADEDDGLGSGETDWDLTWAASRGIGGKAGAHLNAGYSWIGGVDADVWHYGAALDYQFLDALQGVVEAFAEKERADGADTVGQYNVGIRWSPAESLTIDAACGSKVTGDAPDLSATVGLTWAFGFDGDESK